MNLLRIHSFVPFSHANGPGRRATIWVQGCSLGCPGCFNGATHARDGGRRIEIEEILATLQELVDRIEGVTISGGEPLQQRPALTVLLRGLKARTNLSVILLTGLTWEEVQRMVAADEEAIRARIRAQCCVERAETRADAGDALVQPQGFLRYVDVLIAGRYRQEQRLARGLRGSANKTVHLLTNLYSLQDIARVPEAEAIVAPDGRVLLSGVDPLWLAT